MGLEFLQSHARQAQGADNKENIAGHGTAARQEGSLSDFRAKHGDADDELFRACGVAPGQSQAEALRQSPHAGKEGVQPGIIRIWGQAHAERKRFGARAAGREIADIAGKGLVSDFRRREITASEMHVLDEEIRAHAAAAPCSEKRAVIAAPQHEGAVLQGKIFPDEIEDAVLGREDHRFSHVPSPR